MFQNRPRILITLMLVLFILGICNCALATSTTVDNLLVTVKPDKNRYSVTDTAIITVEVTNQNDFPVLDVNAEAVLGKGLVLSKGTEAPPKKEIVIPGERAQFVFNVSLFEVPVMGDSQSILRDVLLLAAALLVLLVLVILSRKRNKKRILPMLLCLMLISSAGPFGMLAQEAVAPSNTVSLNVYFGTTSYPFTATITYGEIDRSLSLGTLTSDEEFFSAGSENPVLFSLPVISALTLNDQDVAVFDSQGSRIASLNDDGRNGDAFAGDYIYSSIANVSAPVQTSRDYYAMVRGNKSNELRFYYFDEITLAEETTLQSVSDHISASIVAPFEKDGYTIPEKADEAVQAVASYAEELLQQGLLIMVEKDEESVWMKFSSGMELQYFNIFQDMLGGAGSSIIQVATFEPYHLEFVSDVPDNAAMLISKTFSNYTFATDLDGMSVTLEAIRNSFKPNSVILWFGHGGYNKKTHSSTWTTLKYKDLSSQQDKNDKIQGRIIGSSEGDAGLTTKFFSKYVDSLQNSFIYLNTCMGGRDDVLANVFLNKGATAVIANTDITSANYAFNMMESIIGLLVKKNQSSLQYYTLNEALSEARGKHEFLRLSTNANSSFSDFNYFRFVNTKVKIFGGNDAYQFRLFEDTRFGSISGKVLLGSSLDEPYMNPALLSPPEPAGGLKISLYKPGTSTQVITATTNSSGNFELSAPDGTYTLKIAPPKLGSRDLYLSFETLVTIRKRVCTDLGTYTLIPNALLPKNASVLGKAINASTSATIDGVNLVVRKGWNNPQGTVVAKTATNSKGEYSLALNPGHYTLTAQKNGFVASTRSITATSQDQINADFSMTPASIDDSYRIVLSWGETPRDLDAHITGLTRAGQGFHVYYQNKSASDNGVTVCALDVDDTNSFGPETITLNAKPLEPYYYYIYNYSDDDTIANSQAKVDLFKGNRLIESFHVPVNQGNGRYWNLFAVVNGGIVTNNTVSNERNITYAD